LRPYAPLSFFAGRVGWPRFVNLLCFENVLFG
jgi:hypothetical protein